MEVLCRVLIYSEEKKNLLVTLRNVSCFDQQRSFRPHKLMISTLYSSLLRCQWLRWRPNRTVQNITG